MSVSVFSRADELRRRIVRFAEEGPSAVDRRLDEIGREWSVGRLVKATTGVVLMLGLALTAFASPWWLILVAAAGGVLVQYWFFPRSWLARVFELLGFRSGAVIEDERLALRILRGDFRDLPSLYQIEDKDAVTRMEGEGGPCVDPDDDDKVDPQHAAELIVQQTR